MESCVCGCVMCGVHCDSGVCACSDGSTGSGSSEKVSTSITTAVAGVYLSL